MKFGFSIVEKYFSPILRKLQTIAQLFDFYVYCRKVLKTSVASTRESLYGIVLRDIDENPAKKYIFLEFGVAWGYTTHYFSSRLDQKKITYNYFGFDTFQGLPRKWREFEKGSFATNGQAPIGISENVEFLIGYVEDTLPEIIMRKIQPRNKNEKLIVLFDLDLMEPTRFCLDSIAPYLYPGDFLYFDEAFDFGERSIIIKLLSESDEFEVKSASLQSLLIQKRVL